MAVRVREVSVNSQNTTTSEETAALNITESLLASIEFRVIWSCFLRKAVSVALQSTTHSGQDNPVGHAATDLTSVAGSAGD